MLLSIVVNGSRGDIQPYIALALVLKTKYNVRILTSVGHKSFVEDFGLHHVKVWNGDVEKMMKTDKDVRAPMINGDVKTFYKVLGEKSKSSAKDHVALIADELQTNRPDLLIVGTLADYYEFYSRLVLKLPTIRVSLQMMGFNEEHAPSGLPTLPGGKHLETVMGIHARSFDGWRHLDKEMINLGLLSLESTLSKEYYLTEMEQRTLGTSSVKQIVCQSKLFKNILFPAAGENFIYTGPCILDGNQQKKNNSNFGGNDTEIMINEFIERDCDRKPVYCGWGSMIAKSSKDLVEFAVKSLMISGERGLILGGYADLTLDTLKKATDDEVLIAYAEDNVLFVDKASHENLFPRMKCIVHHGGSGTTQTALRSGVPTIITPVFLDQFDHAYVVEKLGVGIGFKDQIQHVSAESLGEAIKSVVNDGKIALRSKEVASKIITEDGKYAVAAEIDSFLESISNSTKE